ncbi:MAG: hypothetical protein JXQ73_25580 [Phycisphaerae bacterium]|nr:hypothetical protein [Phycisphaerae bacterium]
MAIFVVLLVPVLADGVRLGGDRVSRDVGTFCTSAQAAQPKPAPFGVSSRPACPDRVYGLWVVLAIGILILLAVVRLVGRPVFQDAAA